MAEQLLCTKLYISLQRPSLGRASAPDCAKDFSKALHVCDACEQAGRELATLGHIRLATQRRANQKVVPVPFFHMLKHLKPVKMQVLDYMQREAK